MIHASDHAARSFQDLVGPNVDRKQLVLTTCKAIHTNHVVYSVLLNDDIAFEVVLPVAIALVLVLEAGTPICQDKDATDEALRQVNVPLFDALAHAFVNYSSLPEKAKDYLLKLAGGHPTRLRLARVFAYRYLEGYLGV